MNRSRISHLPCRFLVGLSAAIIVVAVSLPASSASAGTTIVAEPGDTSPYQLWVDQAKAPTPDATVRVVRSVDCNSEIAVVGCAYFDSQEATGLLKLAPQLSGEDLRRVFFHELGHVFDFEHVYVADRTMVTDVLEFDPGTTWRNPVAGLPSPQEWFAEAAANCYFGTPLPWRSYAFPWNINDPQVQAICGFMRTAVTRPAKVPTSFSVVVPPKRKFTGSMLFQPGTLSATFRLGSRSWKSVSSCTDRLGGARRFAFVNTCGRRLVVINRGSAPVRIQFRAVPWVLPSDGQLGTMTRFGNRAKI